MHPKLHPLEPYCFVELVVEPLTVFAEEVVYSKDFRRLPELFAELEVVSDVITQGNAHEVEYRHRVESPDALLPESGRGCLALKRGAHRYNSVLPAEGFSHRRPCVCIPSSENHASNFNTARVVKGLQINVREVLKGNGKARVLVAWRYLVAFSVLFALPPLSAVVLPFLRNLNAHVVPVGLAVPYKDVGEDYLDRGMKDLPDNRVVLGVYALNDTENTLLDVRSSGYTVNGQNESQIVADYVLPWYHSSGCLSAHARICSCKVGLSAVRAVNAHEEHVLAQPPFSNGLLDCEAEGELFQTYRVATVLGVDGVDRLVFEVNVNPPLLKVLAGFSLVEFPSRVNEAEELGISTESLELLVALPIEDELGMGNVGRIR